jgi:arylsulfatase A-like enzyme
MPDRPNVVFVLADQLRAASLPVYGEHQIETPHLDRLAREGRAFDLRADPLEMDNLAGRPEHRELQRAMEARLAELMARRGDELVPCASYASWLDPQRRIVRNVFGPLGDPEQGPDGSLRRWGGTPNASAARGA